MKKNLTKSTVATTTNITTNKEDNLMKNLANTTAATTSTTNDAYRQRIAADNIQELLNPGIVEHDVMIKLATNLGYLDKVGDDLQNTRVNLIELKDLIKSNLDDTHNYKDLFEEYSKLKSEIHDYSLKAYINWKFTVDLDWMESPISTDDQLVKDLYYNTDGDYMLEFMEGMIGYDDPEDCFSAAGMIKYFRASYEETIRQINEVIAYSMQIEELLVRLHNLLIDSPNLVAVLNMAFV